jgi:tetratricopeptide (TPR) repeat protein
MKRYADHRNEAYQIDRRSLRRAADALKAEATALEKKVSGMPPGEERLATTRTMLTKFSESTEKLLEIYSLEAIQGDAASEFRAAVGLYEFSKAKMAAALRYVPDSPSGIVLKDNVLHVVRSSMSLVANSFASIGHFAGAEKTHRSVLGELEFEDARSEQVRNAQAAISDKDKKTYEDLSVLIDWEDARSERALSDRAGTEVDLAYLAWLAGDAHSARSWFEKAATHFDAAKRACRKGEAAKSLLGQRRANAVFPLAILDMLEGDFESAKKRRAEAELVLGDTLPMIQVGDLIALSGGSRDDKYSREFQGQLRKWRERAARGVTDPSAALDPEDIFIFFGTHALYQRERGQLDYALVLARSASVVGEGESLRAGAVINRYCLTEYQLEKGDIDGAEKGTADLVKQARSLANRPVLATALSARAEVLLAREGNPSGPVLALLDEADKIPVPILERIMRLDLHGRALDRGGDVAGAVTAFSRAIALIEAQRDRAIKASGFAALRDNQEVYDHLIAVLARENRLAEAFDVLQRSRARAMRDLIRSRTLKPADPNVRKLLEKYFDLARREQGERARSLAFGDKANPKPDPNLPRQVEEALAAVEAASPNYGRAIKDAPGTLREIQACLPPDAVLIQYLALSGKLAAFCVTQSSLKLVRDGAEIGKVWERVAVLQDDVIRRLQDDNLEGNIPPWASRDGGPANEPLRDALGSLHDMLIAPVAAQLAGKGVVLVVPFDRLHHVPFAALARKDGDGLRFLVEDRPVVTLSAANALSSLRSRPRDSFGEGLLAVAMPAEPEGKTPDISTPKIAEMFPGSDLLSGRSVPLAKVLDPRHHQKRYWYFACHYSPSQMPENPLLGSLELTTKRASPKVQLLLADMVGLPLSKVELVVLANCESAKGEKRPDGSDVLSLGHVVSTCTGASAAIAGLWQVPEEGASALSLQLFRNLADGKAKGEALRQAQLAMIGDKDDRRLAHPFSWAGFTLIGDWR